jgi:hypothetical protein
MRLIEDFGFMEADGLHWPVPRHSTVDGASIPQALWTLIGGPWEGKYRDASVVHDYYCAVRSADWRSVHRMFYRAMLVSGVSVRRAKVMYVAVYFGGPRWNEMVVENVRLGPPAVPTTITIGGMVDRDGVSALDWGTLQSRNPSRAVIEQAQQQLGKKGYYRGAIDGLFGPQTTQALQQFQRNIAVSPDGKLDESSMAALAFGTSSEITLHLDKVSDMVEREDPSLQTLEAGIDDALRVIPAAEGSPRGISVGHLSTLD